MEYGVVGWPGGSGIVGTGAWICARQDGHGPVTPARLDGTVSLIPQELQKKVIVSCAILCSEDYPNSAGVVNQPEIGRVSVH